MKVLVIGANNSGKGTLVKKIIEKTCLTSIGCSTVLYEEGLDITTGKLLPDGIVNTVMSSRISKDMNVIIDGNLVGDAYILDGYPRTLNQNKYMLENILKPDLIVVINISEEEVLRRAVGRRICENCGDTYNLNGFKLPKTHGFCDKCGAKLSQRKDDTEEVVRYRYAEYAEYTEPIVNYYKYGNCNTIVWEFEATESMDEIADKISCYIKEQLN